MRVVAKKEVLKKKHAAAKTKIRFQKQRIVVLTGELEKGTGAEDSGPDDGETGIMEASAKR